MTDFLPAGIKPAYQLNKHERIYFAQLSNGNQQAVIDLYVVHGINALETAVELEKDSGKKFKS